MSVMTMPAVLTHWETTTAPVTLDMREMDSPALVRTYIHVKTSILHAMYIHNTSYLRCLYIFHMQYFVLKVHVR